MKFREHQLDNGLTIIAECNDKAYSDSIAFFVRTGSRDETPEVAGVSHFLEHMVFKGTPRRSAADVNRELDELGSHSNAYTSEEQTVYYATVLPEYQNEVVDLLADMMRPSLRTDDFDTEKQVIIEEIYKYEDQPPYGAHEKCMAAYFGDHPLGKNVLGTVDSVGNMTSEAMRTYFQSRYSPSNITLAACGNVNFEQLVASAEQHCGGWERFEATRPLAPVSGSTGSHQITKESTAQNYSVMVSPAPTGTDRLRYAARLLSYVLGDDSGSRMYWALVDPGLAEYAGSATYEFDGAGVLMTYLCCAPEDTETNLEKIAGIQADLERDGVTSDELELIKSKVCSQLVRSSERPSSRLFSIGNGWLQRGEYRSVKESIDSYRAVTLAEIQEVLAKYPLSQTMTVSVSP